MKKFLLIFTSLAGCLLLANPTSAAELAAERPLEQCGGYGDPPPPPPSSGPAYPIGGGRTASPSSPSTPSAPSAPSKPSTPSTPATPTSPTGPAGPATPGGPAAPGAPASTGGGSPLPTEHGRTAKTFLKMKWDYPVHQFFNAERSKAFTVAGRYSTAIPRSEAFFRVSEADRRPLLVLRECAHCNGTDDALLSSTSGNERTLIMTRWFHCVKMPMDVLHEDHIFRNLFEQDHPPHVFLSRWDGSNIITFEGDANQKDLWDGMYTMLASEYKQDAHKSVKNIELLVAQYDMYDERITKLEYDYELEVEKSGKKSRKSKKLKKRLEESNKDLAELQKAELKASDLKLKNPNDRPNAHKAVQGVPVGASAH